MNNNNNKNVVCAVDIGGTFTDCVLLDETTNTRIAKSLTTYEEGLEQGFFNSINKAAAKLGYNEDEVFGDIKRISHGTTIVTNTLVEKEGTKTGLITTKGHEDVVIIQRGQGRAVGEPPERITNIFLDKPDPVVPRNLIYGINERIDSDGEVVVPINLSEVREAANDLVSDGVGAIAISFLWSFQNKSHEIEAKEVVEEEVDDDIYVSISSEISPTNGEYERTVATCLNSRVGPVSKSYLNNLDQSLIEDKGYDGPLTIMQANGGTATIQRAGDKPIGLAGSGPSGGMRGSERLLEERDESNMIVTDMGGTSFELGLIADGNPLIENRPVIQKHPYFLTKLDIKSIGAGGGSIAKLEEGTGSLKVGPESAGSDPGPACYGLGGKHPTVTDADLVLGYIDPQTDFGVGASNPKDKATNAIENLADKVGLGTLETARGIYEITNSKMANLAKQEVSGRGYDPRDFILISYGGAGPIHAAAYARELSARSIVVPGSIAPVWSAYGISQSDILYDIEEEVSLHPPYNPTMLQKTFKNLEDRGRTLLEDSGVDEENMKIERFANMQYEEQLGQLEVPVSDSSVDHEDIEEIVERFEQEYKQRYTAAALLPEAREMLVSLRINAVGKTEKINRSLQEQGERDPTKSSEKPTREVYLGPDKGKVRTNVFDGVELSVGNEISGNAMIDLPKTSIVVPEGHTIAVTNRGDFEITPDK
jgi:N-methylhydantoinase A